MSYKDNSFPLTKGNVNLTSGTYDDGAYLCTVDGSLTITWSDNTSDTINVVEGLAVNVIGSKSVVITSGTFCKA